MAPILYSRTYPRFPLNCPVIFSGAPDVGEGVLTNLSLMGCSIHCDRNVYCESTLRVSILLPGQTSALAVDLATIKWVRGHRFGVEFVDLPIETRRRLNRTLRIELIHTLNLRNVIPSEERRFSKKLVRHRTGH